MSEGLIYTWWIRISHRWARADAFFIAAVIFVVCCVGVSVASALRPYLDSPVRDLSRECDWICINAGLDRIHCFRDTVRWWTGTWCGEVPFWRPLTSYVLWIMRLLWPSEYMLPRQMILIGLHVCFLSVAVLFLQQVVSRRWITLATIWLFAGRIPSRVSSVGDALLDPKNVPEPLVGMAVLISLLLLAHGRWKLSLVVAVIGVGFKELGFSTWLLAPVILAWKHRAHLGSPGRAVYLLDRIRYNLVAMLSWLAALLALGIVHYLAVGYGYTMGANVFWYRRMLMFFGGPPASLIAIGDGAVLVTAILIAASIISLPKTRLLVAFAGVFCSLLIGVALDALIVRTTLDVSLVRMLEIRIGSLVYMVLWMLIAWETRREWRIASLGLVLAFLSAIPTWMVSQATEHSRYLSSFFLDVTVATALSSAALAVFRLSKLKGVKLHASTRA